MQKKVGPVARENDLAMDFLAFTDGVSRNGTDGESRTCLGDGNQNGRHDGQLMGKGLEDRVLLMMQQN